MNYLESLKSGKRLNEFDEELLQALISENLITDQEVKELREYEAPIIFTNLLTRLDECDNEDPDELEASINSALESNQITEGEADDLLDIFEQFFGDRIVTHDGIEMAACAIPFWKGIETVREDDCIYTTDGFWLNYKTGEMICD